MIASDQFGGEHSTLALLLISLVGIIAAPSLAVYGFSRLAQQGIARAGIRVILQSLAALGASAAIATYVWGAGHLLVLDDMDANQACKDAVGQASAADIDGYEASYIPLRLGCHVANDGTYAAGVPDYVNPVVLGMTLIAVVLAILAALAPKCGARGNAKRGKSS